MTVVVVVSASGLGIGREIATHLDATLHGQFSDCDVLIENYASHLIALFKDQNSIVFVGALGILIRLIAPAITKKEYDPPVIAIAENGSTVIPVLGGHSGANSLASELASFLNCSAAITTAGDLHFNAALDAPPNGWHLRNPENYKKFMATLLKGESIRLLGSLPWISDTSLPFSKTGKLSIHATEKIIPLEPFSLIYDLECLAIGIGCERNTSAEEVINLVKTTLSKNNLCPESIAVIVSIDLKMDEKALHKVASVFKRPVRFFSAAILELETPRLLNPSTIVFKEVGCHGVSEAAALAATGPDGQLVVPKEKSKRATCAIAKFSGVLNPNSIGLPRGKLFVIGTGPGKQEWLTPEALHFVKSSSDLVGYSLYLDLLGKATTGKIKHEYKLGEERDRVIKALNIATEGKTVSLISSGDPGIYAMASLVFDCLNDFDKAEWNRLEIIVSPGISAVQACAAKVGAPLGHDFCAISLSDLLTPWSVIEKRLKAAAHGDFVVALYNPASQKRQTQLIKAIEILRTERQAKTPVIIGKSLGRPEEKLEITTLQYFNPQSVDMLSIVIVGSTQTQVTNGKVFTPRGYLPNGIYREKYLK